MTQASVTDEMLSAAIRAYMGESIVIDFAGFSRMRAAIEAALSTQPKAVSLDALKQLASYWEDGGHRTGVDYVNALQECADQLMTFIDGQSCKQPEDLTAIGEGD